MEKNPKNLPREEIQKMKSPHWRDYPFLLEKKKQSNRGTTKEDINRKKTKQALDLIQEARELGESELLEVWEK